MLYKDIGNYSNLKNKIIGYYFFTKRQLIAKKKSYFSNLREDMMDNLLTSQPSLILNSLTYTKK